YPHLVFQGNVDEALLRTGTPEQVAAATRACVAAGGGRRHIVNLSHGVDRDTPVANFEAFVRAARGCWFFDCQVRSKESTICHRQTKTEWEDAMNLCNAVRALVVSALVPSLGLAQAGTRPRYVEPNTETGMSHAVVVPNVPLAHTAQLLPLDAEGRLVGKGQP